MVLDVVLVDGWLTWQAELGHYERALACIGKGLRLDKTNVELRRLEKQVRGRYGSRRQGGGVALTVSLSAQGGGGGQRDVILCAALVVQIEERREKEAAELTTIKDSRARPKYGDFQVT